MKNPFKIPSADDLARAELAEARRALLAAHTAREHAICAAAQAGNHLQFQIERVDRLAAHVETLQRSAGQ